MSVPKNTGRNRYKCYMSSVHRSSCSTVTIGWLQYKTITRLHVQFIATNSQSLWASSLNTNTINHTMQCKPTLYKDIPTTLYTPHVRRFIDFSAPIKHRGGCSFWHHKSLAILHSKLTHVASWVFCHNYYYTATSITTTNTINNNLTLVRIETTVWFQYSASMLLMHEKLLITYNLYIIFPLILQSMNPVAVSLCHLA